MKKLMTLVCILSISCFILSCGNDSEDELQKEEQTSTSENNNEGSESNDSTKTGTSKNNSDSIDVDSTTYPQGWPSEETMASETYYPIGTKWQEVWSATQRTKNEPYGYFYIEFEVVKDTISPYSGLKCRYASITDYFKAPEEISEPGFILNDIPWNDKLYIYEEDGLVYQMYIEETAYKPLAYNFVWTIGLELYRDMNIYGDEQERMGVVSANTVDKVVLLDGKEYLYIPSAEIYRGIGKVNDSLFPYIGVLSPSMFEVHVQPIGVARFWRNGNLIYENTALNALV